MPNYRIYRMKDSPRQQFRWAPHLSGCASLKPKEYEPRGEVQARHEYEAWQILRESEEPIAVGDILETEDGQLRICKYVGFEPAQWVLPEPKHHAEPDATAQPAVIERQLGGIIRDIRLGDDIDDFCVRCKRVMNHAVVSVIDGAPAKVRCRTCHSDHDYRHEQAPPPKVDARKAAAFQEVLKKVSPDGAAAVDDVEEVPDLELEGDAEAMGEVEGEPVEMAVVEDGGAESKAESKPKAKAAKAKGRGKK